MTFKRLWQTFRLFTIRGSEARTEFIRKQHVYGSIGDNCTIQKRKVPLYANLIRLGNNVHIASNVSQNAQVFWAEKDSKIIAVAIMLAANGRMNYHLSGSLREYSSLAPGNLLLYQAALWGCANGCKTLYLGGGVGSGEDSLFKFKRAFYRGELNHFYIGKQVYDPDKYQDLVSMREPTESGFFPKYRA